ncbi:hypothetical protein [Luethyella okanaganae]|uniref:Sugar-binding protein n=1 Tax=Luethyella okanaganae TaxID=69372 RepID=A0ABW1VAB5_9MICO
MKKTRMRRLLVALVASTIAIPPGLTLATAPAVAAADPVPLVVDAQTLPGGAGAAGPLDLTATGSIDWVHVAGTGNDRKNVAPVIEVANLNPNAPVGTFTDSAYSYRWSDGTPTATSTGVTTGGVFNYDTATVGATNGFDAGYRVSVPAADSFRRLTIIGGAWQSDAAITVATSSAGPAVYTTSITSSGDARVKKYSVTLRPGQGAVFTSKMTLKRHAFGNLSLAAAVLEAIPAGGSGAVVSHAVPTAMNLTAEGPIDWLHLDGATINRSNRGGNALGVANRATKLSINTQGDNPVTYSWTDGTPLATQNGTTHGGVFYADSADFTKPYGWNITVAADPRPRVLKFVTGVWQSSAKISVYLNGSTTAASTNTELVAGGTSLSKLYTLGLAAGDSAVISAQLTARTHNDGNIALGGVALAESSASADALQAQVDEVNAADLFASDAVALTQLDRVLAETTALLDDPAAEEAAIDAARILLSTAYDAARHSTSDAQFTYQSNPGLTSSFGWEGDKHAPIAFIDGSYKLRDRGNLMVTFGVPAIPGKIGWTNAEGYLPAFISEYGKRGLDVTVQSFSDEATIGGNRFEIAYSRMTTTNTTDAQMKLPVVSSQLVPLNSAASSTTVIEPGQTMTRDYAIAADRFNGTYGWPSTEEVAALGGYDTHYDHMRDYWNDRLSAIADITALPDEDLINAYKAGYIYTLLIRDDLDGRKELHVGENGYDEMFDHDTIGIVANLLTIGDFTYAKDYLSTLPAQLQYDDAKWKYSWPFALYLQRTGDLDFIRAEFENIKTQTHKIETDRINGGTGIMKQTNAIDSAGYWTIDNWSALTGLTTYRYLAEQLGETAEANWARAEYDDLQAVATARLQQTIDQHHLDYIPISMVEPNETGPRSDPRDANWASMFLFGRWAWDGYLFGADQSGIMLDWIDQTYTHGFGRRADISDTIYNFGGYPHGFFSSAYNAGYGSAALRGEQYRDAGIRAYQFMIDKAQSGPFGWWEGVDYPSATSPWNIDHASGGGGSDQHMWGQSTATKVLFDSLIAEKADGTVIIGRGVPTAWTTDGQQVALDRYPVVGNGRVGYSMTTTGTDVKIDFDGDISKVENFSVELLALKDNIASVSTPGATIDPTAGTVRLPHGTSSVTITMKHAVHAEGEALSVSGAAKVGETLHAVVSEGWTASSYQWTRNGEPIASATSESYVLTPEDADAVIGVQLQASRPQWSDATASAEVGPVDPAAAAALTVSAEATGKCVAGKVYLSVTVLNRNSVPVGVDVPTTFGATSFTNVAAGKNAFHAFTTRQASVVAGSARVHSPRTTRRSPVADTHP